MVDSALSIWRSDLDPKHVQLTLGAAVRVGSILIRVPLELWLQGVDYLWLNLDVTQGAHPRGITVCVIFCCWLRLSCFLVFIHVTERAGPGSGTRIIAV